MCVVGDRVVVDACEVCSLTHAEKNNIFPSIFPRAFHGRSLSKKLLISSQ